MKDQDVFKVYLADDDTEDQEVFQEALSEISTKVELSIFNNGLELMADLQTDLDKPDIIFLDLYMPQMDGEECLKEMRQNEAFNDIPIVIYSNEFDIDRIEDLFSLGANRYLRKPDSYSSLVAALDKTVISLKRNTLGGTAVINIIV